MRNQIPVMAVVHCMAASGLGFDQLSAIDRTVTVFTVLDCIRGAVQQVMI